MQLIQSAIPQGDSYFLILICSGFLIQQLQYMHGMAMLTWGSLCSVPCKLGRCQHHNHIPLGTAEPLLPIGLRPCMEEDFFMIVFGRLAKWWIPPSLTSLQSSNNATMTLRVGSWGLSYNQPHGILATMMVLLDEPWCLANIHFQEFELACTWEMMVCKFLVVGYPHGLWDLISLSWCEPVSI